MTSIAPVVTLYRRDYDAVLFDLDGVLTRSATVHAAAWKRLFDEFLEQWAAATGEAFVPFDIDVDYRGSALHVRLALRRSAREVVMAEAELNGTDGVGELRGEGQRLTHQPGHTLA